MKRHLVIAYWLLLLVSTLAIGAVAFYLLQRESDHLRQVAANSVVNTAKTVVANCETQVEMAKSHSLDAVGKFSDDDIVLNMMNWRENNPYSRLVFVYQPGAGLAWPRPFTTDSKALEPLIHRRNGGLVWGDSNFGQTRVTIASASIRGGPPPRPDRFGSDAGPPPDNNFAGGGARQQLRDIMSSTTANGNISVTMSGNSTPLAMGNNALLVTANGLSDGNLAVVPSDVANIGLSVNDADNPSVAKFNVLPDGTIVAQLGSYNDGMTPGSVQFTMNQQSFELVARSRFELPARPDQGWVQVGPPDYKRWLGWMRANPDGPVRGLVLSWDALGKSFDSALNVPMDPSAGYILRNPAGVAVAARFANGKMVAGGTSREPVDDPGARPVVAPIDAIPLNPATMPGWMLEVYFEPSTTFTSFMAVNTVMVAILVISVLVGGTLLLREARREASEAARKTNFVSNVSHELKTPLTTIRMYAELLGEGRVRDQAKQRNYLTTIINESQRLTRLVNNVLDFSRLEQGHKQYHPDDLELAPVIEGVLEAQRPRLEEAGFTIEMDFPPGQDVRVRIDRDAFEQVLINLMDNAMKYASSGHWLGIRVGLKGERATVTVSDHGSGVPTAHRERIFQMFHRVDDSIIARLPGAGLGLSIARRLLRDQEGDLTYAPNEPHGSSFIATLPLASTISAAKIS